MKLHFNVKILTGKEEFLQKCTGGLLSPWLKSEGGFCPVQQKKGGLVSGGAWVRGGLMSVHRKQYPPNQ